MNTGLVILLAVLGGCITLTLDPKTRVFGIIGAVAVGIRLAISFGWLSLRISGINLGMVLALALVIAGVGGWMRSPGKVAVTISTAIATAGVMQALAYF